MRERFVVDKVTDQLVQLALRCGTRSHRQNGIALSVPDDVTSAVIRPLIANQGVRIVVSRDGATHDPWLANVACA